MTPDTECKAKIMALRDAIWDLNEVQALPRRREILDTLLGYMLQDLRLIAHRFDISKEELLYRTAPLGNVETEGDK